MELTPKEIVAALNQYIIGQENAKKSVAVALRNRWRSKQLSEQMREEVIPKNILLIGPTGVGKTEIARRLAKLVGAPFIKVEATKYTEVGYVGRDVEQMIRDLLENSIRMIKERESASHLDQASELADKRVCQILWPKAKKEEKRNPLEILFSGESQEATTNETPDVSIDSGKENKREKLLQQIRNNELDEREIEIELEAQERSMGGILSGNTPEELTNSFQDMLGSIIPKKKKKKHMTIGKARKIFVQEEAQKLIDMDTVIDKAIKETEQSGIVFIDEFDKIAERGHSQGPDVSREGVQRDILPIVEGAAVNTKYGTVKTDHILFIAAGAFHVSKPSDLIPELQGRFPIRVELQSLNVEDLKNILTEPRQSLIKQYTALLATEGVTVRFEESGIAAIAEFAYKVNLETENIGARRLHTILEKLLEDVAFEAPDIEEKNIVIDEAFVNAKLFDVVQNIDLSHYIL